MFLDIHTHSYYQDNETTLLLNTFPEEEEKLNLPVYLSIGLHPWHIQQNTVDQKMQEVEKSAMNSNVIAIGETGLDKSIKVDYLLQQKVFKNHLLLAEKLRKPVIIHCVRSYSEMLFFRKHSDLSIPWIIHWFNSDIQMANELIRKNCFLSFGHMLFHENSKAFKAFKSVAPNHVFFETDDAGYSIQEVYRQAAILRNIDTHEWQKQIMDNFARCFQR
jgi:TatD DNase family protein